MIEFGNLFKKINTDGLPDCQLVLEFTTPKKF